MFGERLKKLRIEKDMSQDELGSLLDVRKSSISNWETNKATPTFDILIKLADIFNVTVDYLLGVNKNSNDFNKLKTILKEAGMLNSENENMSKEDFEKALQIVSMLKDKKDTK